MKAVGATCPQNVRFLRQNAGIERKLMETQLSAGTPACPDLADRLPPHFPVPSRVEPADELGPNKFDRDFLRQLGMTKSMAAKILADGKSQRYLNTKITARVMLVAQANSVDELMKTQRVAAKMGKDKSIDARTRCACLAVVPQCGMALARLSEAAIGVARNLDEPEDNGEGRIVKPVQNNFFGFPPVATKSNRTTSVTAKIGDSEVTNVEEAVNGG